MDPTAIFNCNEKGSSHLPYYFGFLVPKKPSSHSVGFALFSKSAISMWNASQEVKTGFDSKYTGLIVEDHDT